MSQTFKGQVKIPQPKEGIIRSAALDDMISDEKSLEMSLNMDFDSIGRATARLGLSNYDDCYTTTGGTYPANRTSGYWTMGTYNKNGASTNNRLLTSFYNSSFQTTRVDAWNPFSAGTPSHTITLSSTGASKVRFTQFTDYTYFVSGNGANGDVLKSFNTATGFGTSNTGSLPKGDHIESFGGRIWIADSATDRIYYSDVVSATGVITGGTSYLGTLSPQDGEQITGLKRYPKALLVFKENHIFRVYSTDSADAYPCANVGTFSSESIVDATDGLYFHHSSGFYKFMPDQPPMEISQRIKDFVGGISRLEYNNVFGWTKDDKIYWSVGDVTVGSVEYKNCVLVYTTSKEIWTVYSYGRDISSAVRFDDGQEIHYLVAARTTQVTVDGFGFVTGDTWSKVYDMDMGATDDGIEIPIEIITRWAGYTATVSKIKSLGMIAVQHENLAGATVQYQIDNDQENTWTYLGRITSDYISELPLDFPKEFRRCRFRITSVVFNKPFIYPEEDPSALIDAGTIRYRPIYKSIDIPLLEDLGYDTV